jgi:hypothetical protein
MRSTSCCARPKTNTGFGGGRPPKLDEDQQEELVEMLRDGQPWKSQEIQHLLAEEFGVEYSPNYLGTFLRNLGLSYAKPRPKRPHQPENPDEDDQPHNKRKGDDGEGWVVEEDVCTDGGTVLGFFDASKPQPYDDSRRVWYVDDPHIERPLVKTHDSAVGFYVLNGESHVTFTEDEKKERICGVLEQIWDYLKWTMAPIIVEDEDEFENLVRDTFEQITRRVSFAKKWCEKSLDFQRLS